MLVVKDPASVESSVPGILGMNVIRHCYQELVAARHVGFPSWTYWQSPSLLVLSLRPCCIATRPPLGLCSFYGCCSGLRFSSGADPGGVMKMVASTCPEQFSGQSLLFEPPESGLPAGLLAFPSLVQVVRGTTYIPVVSDGTAELLLYPRTCLGALSPAEVVSLPLGSQRSDPLPLFLLRWLLAQGRVESNLLICLHWQNQSRCKSGHCCRGLVESSLLMRVTLAVKIWFLMTFSCLTTSRFRRDTDASHLLSMRQSRHISISSSRPRS